MKILFLLSTAFIFAACSTAYKSGQTPDDLYYSKPTAKIYTDNRSEIVRDNIYEERQLRMAAYDYRWRTLDSRYDFDYRYNPYNYGYDYGYYYNPYYSPYPVFSQGITFTNPKNTTIRKTNLDSYNNTITTFTPSKGNPSGTTVVTGRYNNSNVQQRRSVNNENRTYNTPRTYNVTTDRSNNSSYNNSNNSSNNSSRSSSSGGGTPVQRPSRGN